MNKAVITYFTIAVLTLVLCRCKKDATPVKVDDNTSTAFVHSYMENASSDIDNIGEQAGNADTTTSLATYKIIHPDFSVLSTCAVITLQKADTSNADTLTVDFGTASCVGGDGKTRTGKLQYTYAGGKHYRDSGIVVTCTLVEYFVEGSKITGTKSITNKGRNVAGNINWYISESLVMYKASNGGTVTYNAARNKELMNTSTVYTGPSDPINWLQAKIGISGTASGVADDGESYTAIITDQLVRDFSCTPANSTYPHRHPFIKGKIDFKPGDKLTRTIGFGNGSCDFNATIVIDEATYNFGL